MPHILVADDDRVLTQVITSRLRAAGYTCATASDAMQALMLAVKTPPDVMLLDIEMPAGSGLQALQRLKASSKTAGVPVIVISGSTDPMMPEKATALGALEYIRKPLDMDALIAKLDVLTGKR